MAGPALFEILGIEPFALQVVHPVLEYEALESCRDRCAILVTAAQLKVVTLLA